MNHPVESLLTPEEVIARYPAHDYSVTGLFESRLQAVPDKPLIVFEGKTLTYRQVAGRVDAVCHWLVRRGIGPGDRLAVFSTNHPTTVVLLLALARLGAILVPLNPDYGVAEAAYVLGNAEVSGLVCAPETLQRAQQAVQGMKTPAWLVVNEACDAPVPLLDDELDAFDLSGAALPAPVPQAADRRCIFIYTSGTTGSPKGAMHTQRGYVLTAEGFIVRLYVQPDDRLMCVLPLFHVNALFYSLGSAIAAGATLVLVRRFSAGTFWQTAEATGATEVNLIGAAARILTLRDRSEFRPGHAIRKAFVAPLDPTLLNAFQNEFGVRTLIECYGMTEIPGVLSNPFPGPHKLGSMGTVSPHLCPGLPQPQFRVVDESFQDVPNGEKGLLLVRTPTIMQGYYGDPARTAESFHDGWFITGDIVWRDDDNFFWFVARQKDIIRRRGENVSGAELDGVLNRHPHIVEAAAIGVPAELGEEDILVVVVPQPGSGLQPTDIADWVKQHLSAAKVPDKVVFTDELPKTPTQRVEKFKLKANRDLLAHAVVVR